MGKKRKNNSGTGQGDQRRDGQKEQEVQRIKKRTRRGELQEDVSEAFDIFSPGGDLESCGGLSWRDLLEKPVDLSDCEFEVRVDVSVVPGVTDVLVSPLSVVTVFCDGFFVLLYLGI